MSTEQRTSTRMTIREAFNKFVSGDALGIGQVEVFLRAGSGAQGTTVELVVTTANLEVVVERAAHGKVALLRIGKKVDPDESASALVLPVSD